MTVHKLGHEFIASDQEWKAGLGHSVNDYGVAIGYCETDLAIRLAYSVYDANIGL